MGSMAYPVDPDEDNMADKYDDLFDFYIKLYDDAISRFRELDNKIARYLSAYSILIALTGFVGLNLRSLFNGSAWDIWVSINNIILVAIVLFLLPGYYYLLSALKMEELKRFGYDDSVIEFFLENRPIDIKYALSRRAKEAIEYNMLLGNQKGKMIAKAIKWSVPSMVLFVVSLLLAIFNVYAASNIQPGTEREDVTMSKRNQPNTPQHSQPESESPRGAYPNPEVEAPRNVFITEGYEPPTQLLQHWYLQQIIDDFRESEWEPMGITPRSDFVKIEVLHMPHEPPELPKGQAAVYVFSTRDYVLKIGKAEQDAQVQYNSQYYINSTSKTLAESLVNCNSRSLYLNTENVGDWIKKNTTRVNFILSPAYSGNNEVLDMLAIFVEKQLQHLYDPRLGQ